MMKKQPGSRTRASCSRLFSPGKEPCRAPVGRGDHTPPPNTRRTPCHPPVIARALCARGNPQYPMHRAPCHAPGRGTFCHQRQKVPKERRQNQGFGILPRLEHVPPGSPLPRVPNALIQSLAFVSPLRRHPLAAHAGPRWPGAAGKPSAPTARLCTVLLCLRRGDPRGRPPYRTTCI